MSEGWLRGVLRGNATTAVGPTVVKLGGSLLSRPGWADAVPRLLDTLPGRILVVVGGGPLVDGLRTIDRAAPQPAAVCHRLAIDCLAVTARLVAAALDLPLVADIDANTPRTAVLDAARWLDRDGRLGRLPVGWHVTSDSIAATVATESGRALLLVKSVPPAGEDLGRLAASGWVDGWFPEAARTLAHVGWAAPA